MRKRTVAAIIGTLLGACLSVGITVGAHASAPAQSILPAGVHISGDNGACC